MSNFDIKYYKLNKILLSAIGLWPYQEASQYYFRRTVVFLMIFTLSSATIAGVLKSDWNIDLFAEMLPLTIILFVALLKYFVWWYKKDKMQMLLESIVQDWNSIKSGEQYKILDETNNEGRKYTLRCAQFLYTTSFLFNFSPLSSVILDVFLPLNQSRSLQHPLKADYYIDPQKHFYPILLHMYFGATVVLTIVLSTDLMYISKLHHACGLFRLAGYQISAALSVHKNGYYFENSEYTAHDGFVTAVKYHRKAIRFTARINGFYQWLNSISLGLVIVSLTVSLFCAAAFIDRWKEMALSLICAIGQVIYIFVVMYPGQLLINNSANVLKDIYNSSWYSAPISTQKLMIIVMQKCLTPSVISIGKIVTSSMECYSTIIQTSMSYFMALFSLR